MDNYKDIGNLFTEKEIDELNNKLYKERIKMCNDYAKKISIEMDVDFYDVNRMVYFFIIIVMIFPTLLKKQKLLLCFLKNLILTWIIFLIKYIIVENIINK